MNDLKDRVLRMSGSAVIKCMRCGKCSATCPSYDEMEYHPHEFVYIVERGDVEKLTGSESLYKCLTCFACVERCPRGVEPAKVVEAVRLIAEREQGKNRLKPDDIPALLDADLPGQALVTALRKAKLIKESSNPQKKTFNWGFTVFALAVLITFAALLIVLI
jgi:heterodisulfide reductase subunit C